MGYPHSPVDENEYIHEELRQISQRNRFKRNLLLAAIVFLFVIALALFAWWSGMSQATKKLDAELTKANDTIDEQRAEIERLKNEPVVVTPVTPTIDLQVLHTKIDGISELATVEYLFTDAAMFSASRHLFDMSVPLTEKSFIVQWDGTIKAGVDLKQVRLSLNEPTSGGDTPDSDNPLKEIIVFMPPAKILSYEIDDDSVKVLNESSNIFNPITVDDKVSFDAETKDSMKRRAIENGLLEKAQENAKEILKQLILFDSEIEKYYTVKFVVTK